MSTDVWRVKKWCEPRPSASQFFVCWAVVLTAISLAEVRALVRCLLRFFIYFFNIIIFPTNRRAYHLQLTFNVPFSLIEFFFAWCNRHENRLKHRDARRTAKTIWVQVRTWFEFSLYKLSVHSLVCTVTCLEPDFCTESTFNWILLFFVMFIFRYLLSN